MTTNVNVPVSEVATDFATSVASNRDSVFVGLLSEGEKSEVQRFCQAVRAKEKWYLKILDQERDLGTKWAQEAGRLQPDKCWADVDLAIRDAIEYVFRTVMERLIVCILLSRDLRGEASRIRVFDHTTTPHYSRLARPVDYHQIDSDVLNALKYLRRATFAIQKARLRQDTGIFVSDGAVPESLHREVG